MDNATRYVPRNGWEHEFEERRRSLLSDGWKEQFCARSNAVWLSSMYRPGTSHKIALRGYPVTCCVVQYTDGLLRYIHTFNC